MNNWSEDIIKALEKHIESDKPTKTSYGKQFYQSLLKYRPTYHFLADIISANFKPGGVLDWGCGCGFILEKLKMHGITNLLGIEGSSDVKEFIPDNLKENILIADVLTYTPSQKYDLSVTIEVAEHLQLKDSARFVNNICNYTNENIWWTSAVPGQKGTDHINLQPLSWWISIFKEVGLFEPEWELTYSIKQDMLKNHQLCLGFPWLRDNLVIFKKI